MEEWLTLLLPTPVIMATYWVEETRKENVRDTAHGRVLIQPVQVYIMAYCIYSVYIIAVQCYIDGDYCGSIHHSFNVITCLMDSFMEIYCCCVVIDCGFPPSPANGVVTVSNAVFDSVANYSCKIGYYLSGDVSRRCGRDGEWSNRQPTCAGKYRARY